MKLEGATEILSREPDMLAGQDQGQMTYFAGIQEEIADADICSDAMTAVRF